MKYYVYAGLAVLLVGFIKWYSDRQFDAGQNKAALVCSLEREEVLIQHTIELGGVLEKERAAVQAADNIAKAHYTTIISEVEKNAALQKKLSRQSITKNCRKVSSGGYVSTLSEHSIRVLNQCSQNNTLPEATEIKGFIAKDEVTATDLAGYTCKVISEYNRCAFEVNGALEEQSRTGE